MTKIFYRGAHAVFLTYNITSRESFEHLVPDNQLGLPIGPDAPSGDAALHLQQAHELRPADCLRRPGCECTMCQFFFRVDDGDGSSRTRCTVQVTIMTVSIAIVVAITAIPATTITTDNVYIFSLTKEETDGGGSGGQSGSSRGDAGVVVGYSNDCQWVQFQRRFMTASDAAASGTAHFNVHAAHDD